VSNFLKSSKKSTSQISEEGDGISLQELNCIRVIHNIKQVEK
jgi:hypothetical protein